jgi:nitrogen-specific signal transduction histidine kinase/ActR/RegA family two-component response regulator
MALSTANRQLEDEMAERQAAEAALRQAQKMEAIGRLTGGIAHDFNNLLTAIGGSIEFLKAAAKEQNERAERYYTLGREAVHRAARMTHRLLAFARQQPLEVQPVDLNRLVADMSDLLMRTLGEDVEVETVLAGGLWPTRSDPVQIENALLNLAINARDAMPDGGRLTIETANASLDSVYAAAHAEVEPGQYVMLAVSDTGSGMSADTASRAFDPFFTTKPAGKGTGLGLSMIYGFSKQSGGHLKIYSELGRGTTIKLYLPRLTAEVDVASARAAPALAAAPARAGEAVLVVEDDAAVREMSTEFLRSLGYAVFDAADAATGLRVLRSRPEISVLFTDVVLSGGMSGRELADLARTERPDLPILFTTGYTPNAIIHGGILDSGVDLLPKPFTAEALGAKLRTVLDRTKTTAKA